MHAQVVLILYRSLHAVVPQIHVHMFCQMSRSRVSVTLTNENRRTNTFPYMAGGENFLIADTHACWPGLNLIVSYLKDFPRQVTKAVWRPGNETKL